MQQSADATSARTARLSSTYTDRFSIRSVGHCPFLAGQPNSVSGAKPLLDV